MKTVVVTTSPGFGNVGRIPDIIKRNDWDFIRCIDTDLPDGGMTDYLDRMQYLVVGLIPAQAEVINNAPNLRAILKHGVGVDNIDISAATARGIPVLNTPGANANAVAELALCGMLSLARHLPMMHRAVQGGRWHRYVGTEVEGKTLGIIGLGNTGRRLALKAKSLGLRILANDLRPDKEFAARHDITLCDKGKIYQESDFISLHVFGGAQNVNLIGKEQLAAMKPTASLLNYARGDIVDIEALADALERECIAGAALDAYIDEPPDFSHRIFQNPNVVFTPHSGSDTGESVERMGLMVCEDIVTLAGGGRPARVLNQEVFL